MLSILLHLFLTIAAPYVTPGAVKGSTVTVERLPVVSAKPAGSLNVQKPDPATAPQVTGKSIGIWDPQRQVMLYEKNADAIRSTASIAKLMTALLVLEEGNDMQAVMKIEREDNDPEGSRLSVPVGARITAHDLLYATLVESANNATEALVRSTGIAEAEFVRRMNIRAGQLGMTNTRFTDVTGLGDSNTSTANDLVKLVEKTFSDSFIAEATTSKSYEIADKANGKKIRIRNTDGLIGTDLRVIGGKTGFTGKAGGNFVSRIRGIGERELIFVVLGSTDQKTRLSDTRALADWAFENYPAKPDPALPGK